MGTADVVVEAMVVVVTTVDVVDEAMVVLVTVADVVVVDSPTELETDDVVEALELPDEDETSVESLYNSSLSPAPQY